VQRLTVEVADRESTHSMAGAVFLSGAVYWQGFGDWGGGNFALASDARGRRSYGGPASIPGGLLERILLVDEASILTPPAAGELTPAVLPGGEAALAARQGAREWLLRRGAAAGSARLEVGRDGRWLSTVTVEEWYQQPDASLDADVTKAEGVRVAARPAYPRRIAIEGRDRGYRAWIDVLSWETVDLDEREFREEFDGRFTAE
jgi:hypothetical protein